MNRTFRTGPALSLLLALAAVVAVGQTPETAPDVDPEVEEIMRAWSDAAAERQAFRFEVVDTIEEVLETGETVDFSHRRTGLMRRPDRLRIISSGDIVNRELWFDGTTVTLYDGDDNVYGQVEIPGTVEEMMDTLIERYGVSTPLADLLSTNPREVMSAEMQTAHYLGPGMVGDHDCDHLAFTGENVDWQIWIDAGEVPQLRKLAITYKLLEGEPKYTVVIESVTPLSDVSEDEFAFEPPEGADEIEILAIIADEVEEEAESN